MRRLRDPHPRRSQRTNGVIGVFYRSPQGRFHKTSAEMVLPPVQSIRSYDDGTDMARQPPSRTPSRRPRSPRAPRRRVGQTGQAVRTERAAELRRSPHGLDGDHEDAGREERVRDAARDVLPGEAAAPPGARGARRRGRALAQGAPARVVLARHDGGLAQGQGRRAASVNRWRVEISRSAGTLKIIHRGRVVRTAQVGTGTNSTPTPAGLHATYDHWRSDHAVLGDWTVSLTTHSPQVPVFDGKQAVVAIHGWGAERRRQRRGEPRLRARDRRLADAHWWRSSCRSARPFRSPESGSTRPA